LYLEAVEYSWSKREELRKKSAMMKDLL
jgi:hypothetical protein